MNQKAQAGLEYLVTYGWAIVLIVTVIGTLVLIINQPLEEIKFTSSDPTKLTIKGSNVENGVVTIKLQNITGGTIEIQDITTLSGYPNCTTSNTSNIIGPGGELEILCTVPTDFLQGTINIEYIDTAGLLQNTTITSSGDGIVMEPPSAENTDYLCSDQYDNDGDQLIDCLDPDCQGYTGTGQYPDGAKCEYETELTCNDLFDNDADGLIDGTDDNCVEQCDVIGDEDNDGLADCLDPECSEYLQCYAIEMDSCQTMGISGKTYYLTEPFGDDETVTNNCIYIQASNITLDCQDYPISTSQAVTVVYITGNNATLQNCNISSTGGKGVEVYEAMYANIKDSTLTGNAYGIKIVTSNNQYTTIQNNTITNNTSYGIYQRAANYDYYDTYTIIQNNTISGNGMGYYNYRGNYDQILNNQIINNNNQGMLLMSQAYNATIEGNAFTGNGTYGLEFDLTNRDIIRNNSFNNNGETGFYIRPGIGHAGVFLTIENNEMNSNGAYGLYYSAGDSIINNNTACGNPFGDFKCIDHSVFNYSAIGTGNSFTNVTPCPIDNWPELGVNYNACS